jgi:hypothetical protein
MTRFSLALKTLATAGAVLALAGCSYDYLNHEDTVAYHAGNAVRANLEAETTNPSRRSIYSTVGLGRNGNVIPPAAAGTAAPASAPAN